MTENLLFGISSILVLGVAAQWLGWRLRLPSILLLLLFGFLAGPVLGLVDPDRLLGEVLFPVVSLSVAIILFEGGLTLRLDELPEIGGVLARLISVGAVVTWTVAAVAAHFILQLDWGLSILLGAILIVTGPTVIGPLLRQIQPRGQASALLKWEGILIDPVGAVLAVLVFEAIIDGGLQQAPTTILSGVLLTTLIGLGIGLAAAGMMIFLLRRFLIPDHLQNGVALLFILAAYTLSDWLHHESGLLTVTVMGLLVANQRRITIKHIVEFKESLQVLLIGILFIVLAARVEPVVILGLGWQSVVFLAVLILVARPLTIIVSTWGSQLTWKERLFMAWMAPRGIVAAAVASIFSFELVGAGYPGAEELVPLTFVVIMGTVSFYGLTAGPVARWLKLAEQDPQGVLIVGAHDYAREIACTLAEHGITVRLLDNNRENVRKGRLDGLEVYYGNAYSEEVLERLDLTGIGRLLAMTSNDEVNALAALHFPEVFSRAEVYQLPLGMGTEEENEMDLAPQHLTGRILFGPTLNYSFLEEQFHRGASIKATKLTEAFTYRDLQAEYGRRAIPLFAITARGKLRIATQDKPLQPEPGQTVISLILPQGALDERETARRLEAVQPPI
ncbi:MAG: sodium:proton antiporter [Anaerolineae bacterium]|nr:sodium:proton antiporter [Anaerolineae bacterium]